MNWNNQEAKAGYEFSDLADPVGKAGTNDSVAIVSAIIWIARILKVV